MNNYKLTDEELKLFEKIKQSYKNLKKRDNEFYNPEKLKQEKIKNEYINLAKYSFNLHHLLAKRGLEPIHSKIMYMNRRVPVTNIEFYYNKHAVEDLMGIIYRNFQTQYN